MERRYYVYIMASRSLGLYTGVTNHLARRTLQHRNGNGGVFSSRYKTRRLVYVETFNDVRRAIEREKQLKSWRREKKLALIQQMNPAWQDLAENWFGKPTPGSSHSVRLPWPSPLDKKTA